MKTVLGLVLAFALALSVLPAVASDTFHAFSTLPAVEQARLTPLSDGQLAVVEGGAFPPFPDYPTVAINIAILPQINVCAVCGGVVQTNIGVISQGSRFGR
jgi:hypothetical protein